MVSDIDNIDLGSISSQPLLSMNANGESDTDIYSECKTRLVFTTAGSHQCGMTVQWKNPIVV